MLLDLSGLVYENVGVWCRSWRRFVSQTQLAEVNAFDLGSKDAIIKSY